MFGGDIPWCRVDDIEGNWITDSREGLRVSQNTIDKMGLKVYPVGTVLVACSASIGKCVITARPLVSNQRLVGVVCGDRILNTFLRYVLESMTEEMLRIASKGTITGITRRQLDALLVPVPPMEEQKRLVDILDRFDALTTSIADGLPAEIEARRQQYEYYRGRILDFPRKG